MINSGHSFLAMNPGTYFVSREEKQRDEPHKPGIPDRTPNFLAS